MQGSNQKDDHPENSKENMKNNGKRKSTCPPRVIVQDSSGIKENMKKKAKKSATFPRMEINDFIQASRDSHE
ncbi:putative reticulon-4 receptor-like 1 [Sesbania bispinosa]|nr:putative reticulon-4 receptor-like 1 [Sesbania bispinosa]